MREEVGDDENASGNGEEEEGDVIEGFGHADAICGAEPSGDRVEDGGGPGG